MHEKTIAAWTALRSGPARAKFRLVVRAVYDAHDTGPHAESPRLITDHNLAQQYRAASGRDHPMRCVGELRALATARPLGTWHDLTKRKASMIKCEMCRDRVEPRDLAHESDYSVQALSGGLRGPGLSGGLRGPGLD
jgi:hypothetical protein